MRKSDRLFQLTNILRRHQPITAAMLAKKLMVSERTIYRYVDDLSLAG
ncbi:MAG: HTH domain-containing protein, partial [Gammaproteobacteria bacterium]|nr:HTH domain-containing protein [Gammaproteobacteria bacterium]